MSTLAQGEPSRALILDALFDLPLGASLRQVAEKVGLHANTVAHHVARLRKTGRVRVIRAGYQKRKVLVPVRLRLTEEEAEWLKLGTITARAVVVVARAKGKRVSSAEVAKTLGWHHAVTRYHLQRARTAGILEARPGAGYTLALEREEDRELAGLDPRAWEAVRYIARQGRRVTSHEVMEVFGWSVRTAKWHLGRAAKAGLLTVRLGVNGGYAISAGANRINWQKSDLSE